MLKSVCGEVCEFVCENSGSGVFLGGRAGGRGEAYSSKGSAVPVGERRSGVECME